jgi:hypothetical protein
MKNKKLTPGRDRRGALIIDPFGGGTMVGRIGSFVFQRGPFGNMVRTFVKPVNPNTGRQVTVRQYMQSASAGWGAITAGQRTGWISYANNTPYINKTGATVFLSGRSMFIRTSVLAQWDGGTAIDYADAPTTPGLIATPQLTFSYTAGSGEVALTAIVADAPTNFLFLFLVSRNLAPSRNYWKGPFETTATDDEASVLPTVLATLGAVAVGDKVFVKFRALDTDTGKASTAAIVELKAV